MMRLSRLQRELLVAAYRNPRKRVPRAGLEPKRGTHARPLYMEEIVQRSLERLVERGLAVAYGRRTAEKWFVEEISLTTEGRRAAREILKRQLQLPLA